MKILFTNISKATAFKSYTDDGIIGFDDAISQQRRNYLREHYASWNMPYGSIYEKGHKLSEYQTKLMLDELSRYHDTQRIADTTIYRGQTLVDKPEHLKKLKNIGVETVIDLVGYGDSYKNKIEAEGLNYYLYSIYDNWWNCSELDNPKFIDNLTKFLEKMQEGNIYIGCQHGANDTDIALLLNDFFNPKLTDKIKTKIEPTDADFPLRFNIIYDSLKQIHKDKLGWTTEFEKKLIKKLTNL